MYKPEIFTIYISLLYIFCQPLKKKKKKKKDGIERRNCAEFVTGSKTRHKYVIYCCHVDVVCKLRNRAILVIYIVYYRCVLGQKSTRNGYYIRLPSPQLSSPLSQGYFSVINLTVRYVMCRLSGEQPE